MSVSNDVEGSENTERVTWSKRRRDGEMETLYQLREQHQAWLQDSSQVLTSLNYDLMKKQGKGCSFETESFLVLWFYKL